MRHIDYIESGDVFDHGDQRDLEHQMTDRSIIHRTDLPPEGNGGSLIVPIEMRDITGAAVREDGQAVAIRMLAASGDRVLLGMSAAGVDAMIDTLTKIRAQLDSHQVERTIPLQAVNTMQVGVNTVEGVAFVAMIVDRSLPSAAGYLMPPKAARVVAKQLVEVARKASSARGEIIAPDPETACPGHVASSDNPKVCGRCGVHIDSLRPPEE